MNKLWHGADPFAEAFCEPALVDMQGWNSDHPYFRELINAYRPCVIAEIGVWKGGSTIEIARQIKSNRIDAVVIAIDTWLGSWDHWFQDKWLQEIGFKSGYPSLYRKFLSNVFYAGAEDVVVPLPLDSANAFHVLQRNGIKLDFVHIDGAHDYESVIADLRRWWSLLRNGGILVADDYFIDGKTWPGVKRAVDEFLAETPHTDFDQRRGKCRAIKA